jgi:hypothetical protein
MEVIDVLGDDTHVVGPLQVHQSPVCGVGLRRPDRSPPLVVEPEHAGGIPSPSLGAGHVLDPVAFPEPIGTAKGLQAAFGTDPGSGEDHDSLHRQNHSNLRQHLS